MKTNQQIIEDIIDTKDFMVSIGVVPCRIEVSPKIDSPFLSTSRMLFGLPVKKTGSSIDSISIIGKHSKTNANHKEVLEL